MLRDLDWTHALILVIAGVAVVYAMGGTGPNETDITADGQVAEIRLAGTIQSGTGISTDGTTPDGFRQSLDEARQDGNEGYLIVINSPGGSVVASKDITRAIEDLEGPTACLMKDTAASGAYWAATACDEIVADSLTVTGSIGVTSTYMEFSGLLDKLGIEYVNVTAGELKDIGSPLKNMTEEERELLQDQLDTIHTGFIEQIAEGRNMSREEVEPYATGEPILGTDAHDAGLVDTLGSREEAIEYLEAELGSNVTVKEYRRDASMDLLTLLSASVGEGIGRALSGELSAAVTDDGLVSE